MAGAFKLERDKRCLVTDGTNAHVAWPDSRPGGALHLKYLAEVSLDGGCVLDETRFRGGRSKERNLGSQAFNKPLEVERVERGDELLED